MLSACAGKYKHSLEFNPQEPIRVAVMPFAQIDEQGSIIEPEGTIAVDGVPLVSPEPKDAPTVLVRKLVQTELGNTSLDVISPFLVEVDLPHHGFAKEDRPGQAAPGIRR